MVCASRKKEAPFREALPDPSRSSELATPEGRTGHSICPDNGRKVLVLNNPGWHSGPGLAVPDDLRPSPTHTPESAVGRTFWTVVDEPITDKHIRTLDAPPHLLDALRHSRHQPRTRALGQGRSRGTRGVAFLRRTRRRPRHFATQSARSVTGGERESAAACPSVFECLFRPELSLPTVGVPKGLELPHGRSLRVQAQVCRRAIPPIPDVGPTAASRPKPQFGAMDGLSSPSPPAFAASPASSVSAR